MNIPVLFARADSVYKTLPGTDVFDLERDATSYSGNSPVIAHPPCRSWGRMSHFSKPLPGERELAIFALQLVRKNGGVLEHPAGSSLWSEMNLPLPGKFDTFGGFTLCLDQHCFGHKARKRTLLYVVGTQPKYIPSYPLSLSVPEFVVRPSCNGIGKKIITKSEREHTPILFAQWLIDLARLCSKSC